VCMVDVFILMFENRIMKPSEIPLRRRKGG
jgi:hypothetical protein